MGVGVSFYLLDVFKRVLYVEHLLGALLSRAFVGLALLLVFLVMALQRWLAPGAGALHGMFTVIEGLIWCWMPLYLLLMQKRAYGQEIGRASCRERVCQYV